MADEKNSYFQAVQVVEAKPAYQRHQAALQRCVDRLAATMPIIGLRNPKIGRSDLGWNYCEPYDWVIGFQSGQLWLALQLTGESRFLNAARARLPVFRRILERRDAQDHDLGFQFSLSCVANWLMTADAEARTMALHAAQCLLERFHPEGGYLQAWNARSIHGAVRGDFANGRVIADTMQNLALLYWAHRETGRHDFRDAADTHAHTTLTHLVRADDTSFHTFVFDPSSGQPVRGETHQGYRDDSCWSRGQAWLIHGFAQSALSTGQMVYRDVAKRLALKAKSLMGQDTVPAWDYNVPDASGAPRDSSAGAIMAAGVYILADLSEGPEAVMWREFADRLMAGLLDSCDVTNTPGALGFLTHGAAHVAAGYCDQMLPYGDYYFMEALMRSLGHTQFFW